MFKDGLTRRGFLRNSCLFGFGFGISPLFIFIPKAEARDGTPGYISRREAMYYDKREKGVVKCRLCPRMEILESGDRGFCRVRENERGKLYTLVYSNPCAVHIDPIEKKPLFHVLPTAKAFSIATSGCNLRCKFCQNWHISQVRPEETINYELSPDEVVKLSKKSGCEVIAYTYSEPTIFYEYMLATAKIAKREGIMNVYHSNGFINPRPLKELCEYLDAANVDLKGFTDDYYSEMSLGWIEPILNTLKILKKEGVHLEITNLVVPGKNDDMEIVKKMCEWIKKDLGDGTPIHFSRFYPMYKLRNLPPTPVKTLEKARDVALKVGLKYVYIGNVPGHEGENTNCPKCKKLLIQRIGYKILQNNVKGGRCKFCEEKIPGIWK
ncbi:MAG: AmmeMemoRadiSam system radical SAM enzyme [bacterium]|nr:AmmeMemoRadiSam system radical SAM enzyme [bacterium]